MSGRAAGTAVPGQAAAADPACIEVGGDETALRRAVLDCALRLNPLGINHGKSGNVSARSRREGRDGFLVTASGLPYEDSTVEDLAWVPLDAADERDAAGPRLPSSEWRFHRDIYAHRADARAIVHTHAIHATALACLPSVQAGGIPAFHYMIAAAGGADLRCARYATFGTQALSDAALEALAGRRACLLANHGLIALGASLEAALALAVEVEALARMYAQLLAIGERPVVLDADEMARVIERFETYGRPRDADPSGA